MLKLAVAVLAVALAGSASAAGWRSLQVDGSGEEAFAKSLEAFKEKMSPAREYVLGEALKDIWARGAKAAEAEQREYTADEYYRQVDGLRYEEVVKYTDPSGDTAKRRYRLAAQSAHHARAPAPQPRIHFRSYSNATMTTDSNGHPTRD
jgi:opacity protein-like surface antigen